VKKLLLLLVLISVGIVLRVHNISPFKIYPDSYQSLVVAHNILTYHSVVGYLGRGGMLYPDFFIWTRPMYPLLIDLFTLIWFDTSRIAQGISLVAGSILIPVSFFYIKSIFKSYLFGLAAALFVALSFNLTIWSGFIMTESIGVLLLSLFLWRFFATLSKDFKIASLQDFFTGILFAAAVLTRYEYIVLIFPLFFLHVAQGKNSLPRLLTMSVAGIACFCGVSFLFPLQSIGFTIFSQVKDLLEYAFAIAIVSFFGILLFVRNKLYFLKIHFAEKINKVTIGILWIFIFLVYLQILHLPAVRNFMQHDFFLGIFSLVGLTLFLLQPTRRAYGFFCVTCMIFLGIVYHRVNPEMERYMTHFIPFLLIPASYGFVETFKICLKMYGIRHPGEATTSIGSRLGKDSIASLQNDNKKQYVLSVLISLFIVGTMLAQGWYSYQGLRYLHDSSWYRTSYEEKAARRLEKYIPENPLLLVSLPESYYYHLRISTQSIAGTYPFIYIDTKKNPQVLLVVDTPMRKLFPTFTAFVDKNISAYKITSFFVNEKYHQEGKVEKEIYPIVVYSIALNDLEEKIHK